ncbi:hypothetical protein SDC9_61648 [bioreactor metagenome]|uniref:Uncharacterized protein n=1 Tax=bioreactor metagenome TaxID=1076179 RepID=A0A644XGB3_9ZZZZ
MYKSSVWRTYYYRFGIIPVYIGIFLFIRDFLPSGYIIFLLFFSLILLWSAIWSAFFIYHLRIVTATLDGLSIRHSKNNIEKVDYRDIGWIYQPMYINPSIVIFKYRSVAANKEKTIMFINRFDSNTFPSRTEERIMLRFIRFQIGRTNPGYNVWNEPSRMKLSTIELVSFLIIQIPSILIFNFL